ncbi:MAG: phenylacetate-CoA oxygenase/reductase subunit PaaK [Proteobacteria bacterium]|nr:phenylacetate-CoA oxygenase/reductase subunit PaaK [Pseudomonadota bacterium]
MFKSLRISDLRRETPDCVSVAFHVPDDLKKEFSFKAGQYLTLKREIEGQSVRRSYSLCSSPLDGEWRVAIKRLEGGLFSTFANEQLKAGDTLEVSKPEGKFGLKNVASKPKHYVLIAAGSGITPMLSILKTVLATEPESRVTVIYGNRNRGQIIFKQELENLKNKNLTRLSLYHVLSRERAEAEFMAGRIDQDKIRYFIKKIIPVDTIDEVFLCGPEEMILTAKETFIQAGLKTEQVHFELFFSQAAQKKADRVLATDKVGKSSQITLKLDGVETVFKLPFDGENILDAALKNGADLPYACKGGVCATCRAKIEEGEVTMDVNYSLDEDEVKKGFVLACQSHPKSDRVKINFDIK